MLNESNFSSSLQRNLREISERQNTSPALTDHLASYFADIDADNFGDARLEELHGGAIQHFRLGQSRIPD